jgi:hypothetical protein
VAQLVNQLREIKTINDRIKRERERRAREESERERRASERGEREREREERGRRILLFLFSFSLLMVM